MIIKKQGINPLPYLCYLPCPLYFFFLPLREVAERRVLDERPWRVFFGTPDSNTVLDPPLAIKFPPLQ